MTAFDIPPIGSFAHSDHPNTAGSMTTELHDRYESETRAALVEHISSCQILRVTDIADVRDCRDGAERLMVISDTRTRLWGTMYRNRVRPVSPATEREIAPGFIMLELIAIDVWEMPCSLQRDN